MLKKIISGGQTGADMGGLFVAKFLGLEYGGWAAPGYMTEEGPQSELLKSFNLVPVGFATNTKPTYAERTRKNVLDADGTLVISRKLQSAGTIMTIRLAHQINRPLLVNPTKEKFIEWLSKNKDIEILNVAGNRESVAPGIGAEIREFLVSSLVPYFQNTLHKFNPENPMDEFSMCITCHETSDTEFHDI